MADGKVEYEVRADSSNLDNDLDTAEKKVSKSGDKLGKIAGASSAAIGLGFLAAGTAAIGIGVAAVKGANDMDVAMNSFIATTGTAAGETERYQNVLENIYANNYGESFEDIAEGMASVTKTMGELNDEDLQSITESAYALRDTFEFEIPESTRAAKAMMESFGTDGKDAMSMIAAGAQNGLDFSGELLDSISEYSTQFAKVGLGADDMFKIFQSGADTGAWNLDKIGDAVKEFSIRSIDGSKTTTEGFKQIGLNADEMGTKFGQGGETAKAAFDETIKALANMDDPLKQSAAGVALFGTQWEDLGPEVITQLAGIESGAYDAKDAMDGIKKVKYDDMGSMLTELSRSLELLLIPLGEELIPIITEVIQSAMPMIEEVLPVLMELFGELSEQLMPIIEEILPIIIELFQKLAPPLLEIIETILPPIISLLDVLLPIFLSLIDVLLPIIDLFIGLLEPIVNLINSAIVPLIAALTPLISTLIDVLVPVLGIVMSVFSEVFGGIVGFVGDQIKTLVSIFGSIIDFVKNVFTGNWKGAWKNIVDIFGSIFGGIANIFKFPINLIIDLINGFIGGLNKIKIPDWVPGVGGMGINIPKVPRLKVGMDYVPSDYFPAYLDKGEAVLTAEDAAQWRMGSLQGLSTPSENSNRSINVESQGSTKADMLAALRTFAKENPATDTVLQLGYEEVARASNKGNVIIETRYGK